ncbi:MAG: MATE family efflux transporter [Clostridiales bacterium]|jgi:putative MATE family efflux protein|nr:MATE family efflux transporter [Clostridiales bacterium]
MFFHRTRHEVDMVGGPILSNVLRFTIPLILSAVLQLVFNMTGLVVVGRFESTDAVAAVGATTSLTNLIINLFLGFSVGTSILAAQHYGAGSHKDIKETVHTSVAMSVVLGALLAVFGVLTARALLVAMGTPEGAVLDGAALYMRVYFLGMPANMLFNFGASVLRAVGDTKRPLYYLLVAGVVNFLLNFVFIVALRMGVAGVAVATIIPQYISAALVVANLMRSHGSIRLRLEELRIDRGKALEIARIGLPACLQATVFSVTNVLVQMSVNSFGAIAVAGSAAASNIENFVYVSMNSVYSTALAFTGQNVGARRYERVGRVLYICLAASTIAGVTLGVLSVVFAVPLLSIFINPEGAPSVIAGVIAHGQLRLRVMCLPYFACGLMEVLVGVLRGMGDSLRPMIISVAGACVLRILWLYTVFAMFRTPEMLFASYPVSWLLTTVAHYVLYLHLRKSMLSGQKLPIGA